MTIQVHAPTVAANAKDSSATGERTLPLQLRLTYAITPPNQTTALPRRQAIAAAQSARLAAVPIDALLVYDLQDEALRNAAPRPFPFVPKVDALDYAYSDLRVGDLPRVVYRTLQGQDQASVEHWIERLCAFGGSAVFVGAPSRESRTLLRLPHVFSICRQQAPNLAFGGVVIAERHQCSHDEHERVWDKVTQGASFFVSQTMWSAGATNALLGDLKAHALHAGKPMPTLLLTLSPCGSEQTLAFQEWLGVDVPLHIKRELLAATDMLQRSVDLAAEVFAEVQSFAVAHGIAVGCNVESVSSRPAEVEASLELVRRIAAYQTVEAVARAS